MAEPNSVDPFVATDEVEVETEISNAIESGREAADEGRLVSSEEVRKLIPQWIFKFSIENPRWRT